MSLHNNGSSPQIPSARKDVSLAASIHMRTKTHRLRIAAPTGSAMILGTRIRHRQTRPSEYATAIVNAVAYVKAQVSQRHKALEEMLQCFGLSREQSQELLKTHLDLNTDTAKAHPG